jgi:hypothetical protein
VTEVFNIFLGPSRQLPGWYFCYATAGSFQILSNLSHINHPITRHYRGLVSGAQALENRFPPKRKNMAFWVVTLCSRRKCDVSDEYIASNFGAGKYAKQKSGKKHAANRANSTWKFRPDIGQSEPTEE